MSPASGATTIFVGGVAILVIAPMRHVRASIKTIRTVNRSGGARSFDEYAFGVCPFLVFFFR